MYTKSEVKRREDKSTFKFVRVKFFGTNEMALSLTDFNL